MIEAVTGQDYFDVVRERVYARAGMPNSDSYDIDLVVPNLAIGYSRERTAAGTQLAREHVRARHPRRAGRRRLLDRAGPPRLRRGDAQGEARERGHRRAAVVGRSPSCSRPTYGYGFGVGKDALGRRAGHSGGFSGIASVLDIYLDTGWTVVVLSNVDGGMPPVAQKLRETAGRIR